MRNLKALGLMLIAALALSAFGAAAAQADEDADFWAANDAVEIDGVGEGVQSFQSPGLGTLTCNEVEGVAEYDGESPEQTSEAVEYGDCVADTLLGKLPVTVTPEAGCHFTFTAGTYTNPEDIAHGSVHICGVTIDIYLNHNNHTAGIKHCEIHVPPQTVNGVTYHNVTTEGVMAVTIEANGLAVTETVTDFNKLACNNHVHTNATYTGSIFAKATNGAGQYVDTTVTGTP